MAVKERKKTLFPVVYSVAPRYTVCGRTIRAGKPAPFAAAREGGLPERRQGSRKKMKKVCNEILRPQSNRCQRKKEVKE